MFGILRSRISEYSRYDKITSMSQIVRRYFVMNAFDGALTIFGVLLGAFIADICEALLVIKIGISACIAVGVSGLWGALLTESAERKRELRGLEKAMLTDLQNTEIKKAHDYAVIVTALVDGLSPFLAALLILAPFFLDSFGFGLDIRNAYYASFALAISVFFVLGAYLGKIANESIIATGGKLVVAGIVCMLIILFLS